MAALPIIPGTFRIALEWVATGGQTAANVMHIRNVADTATSDDALQVVEALWTASMIGVCSTAARVQTIRATKLDGVSATKEFDTGSTAKYAGSGTGDFVPATAALIKFGTDVRGRVARGRMFLPFITESNQANGFITSGNASAVSAAWDDFRAGILAATVPFVQVVASYREAVPFEITSSICETALATQRRRQTRLRV